MKLLNIRQLILIIFLIIRSQCLGYIMLMSQDNSGYQQYLPNTLTYYTTEEDIISGEQPYYEGTGETYDAYQVTPYEYVVDDDYISNNGVEYVDTETNLNYLPTSNYQVNYDDSGQYYGPVEYSGTYNDYAGHDYNAQYDEYYPRQDVSVNYQTRTVGRHATEGQYNDYSEKNYYRNEDNYEDNHHNNYDTYNAENNVDNRDYYNLPTTSYKHQKYVPHSLVYLKDYIPIDEKLYVFYPKNLKQKYYTLRTIQLKHGQYNPYFSSKSAKKSQDGNFKEIHPKTNTEYPHGYKNLKIHDYNKNDNNYYTESSKPSNYNPSNYHSYNRKVNYKPIEKYSSINYNHGKNNNHAKTLYNSITNNNNYNSYKYSSKQNYNDYNEENKPQDDIILFGDTLQTTDYEESISYHHSGKQDPEGKIRSYSNYDIYGRMKRSGKSKFGRGTKKYHTVIDSDRRKNKHYVTYLP
ncbi:unnamed protein product [Schistosoma margrebowiei]|uniref:Btz domain-containing protein n=2 Tax=Schistosoma margrebowiei TaxID=48269 RepID=A0AA85A7B6_9TREM|nr:unnamed protein product [Schistosoma margrebowiei]